MKRSKIFIDGASFTHRSLGCREMSVATLMILTKSMPNAEYSMLATNPLEELEQTRKWGFNLRIVKRKQSFLGILASLLIEYRRADVIVGIYGDGFTGRKHLRNPVMLSKFYLDFILKLFLINLTRKPFIILPSSLGPFERSFDRFFIRILLNRSKAIMVRERISKRNLEEINVKNSLIIEMPDLAFIMPETHSKEIIDYYKINHNQQLIGIGISQLMRSESARYIGLMADLADYLTSLNALVILIPHEIANNKINDPILYSKKNIKGDDIDAVKSVYDVVSNKQNVIPIMEKFEGDVIKGLIGECDLFIGARTHSIIAALSMGVPTIGIAYSHKTPGVLQMMDLAEYVCDFRTVTIEELNEKIQKISKKFSGKKDLLAKAKIQKEKVWLIGNFVRQFAEIENEYSNDKA
ncbi:MAG: polysaccharide pyruvyl transferase family protein [Bacillota bacterium]